jgi:BON domain
MKIKKRDRHDYGQWGNSNFSQNTSAREHGRIDSNFDNREREQLTDEQAKSRPTRYDFDQNTPYGQPTWGRSNNEAYVWQKDGRQEHHNSHRGKGPKSYKRTDERILEDIHDRLTFDNFLDASNIEVTITNGEVTLTGTVSERADKRRAEDIAESVSGVQHLENRIRVGRIENSGDTKERAESNGKHYKSLINSH